MKLHNFLLPLLLLLLALVLVSADEVEQPKTDDAPAPDASIPATEAAPVDFNKMRTKELRRWLADRGLACKGCAEKDDFVKLALANKDAALVKKDPPPEPEAKPPSDEELQKLLDDLKRNGMGGFQAFSRDDLQNGRFNPGGFNGGNNFDAQAFAKQYQKDKRRRERKEKKKADDQEDASSSTADAKSGGSSSSSSRRTTNAKETGDAEHIEL